MKLREYWQKKTLKQRIYLCVGLGFILIFLFFVIKGNFFDKSVPNNLGNSQTETSQFEGGESATDDTSQDTDSKIHFRVNWIDIGVLTVLFTAYGIHKYREKKKEKRV